MSLRTQLLLVALLTLVLPWAGWRYVTEMEGVLRAGLEQSLTASAMTMAGAFSPQRLAYARIAGADTDATIYAHPLPAAPRVDGYREDWGLTDSHARPLGDLGRYWAGVHERHLYLYIDIDDAQVVYPRIPGQPPYGDRLLLQVGGSNERWLVLNTAAPGVVPARETEPPAYRPGDSFEERIYAVWVATRSGYAAEIRLPLDMLGPLPSLGIAAVNVTPTNGDYDATLTTSWNHPAELPGHVVRQRPALAAIAAQFDQPGRRLRIVDAQGWVLYDGGSVTAATVSGGTAAEERGFLDNLLRLILRREDAPYTGFEQPPGFLHDANLRAALDGETLTAWYRRASDADSIVVAAVPIHLRDETEAVRVQGALLLETGTDSILTLTNDALVRLLGFTILASLIAAVALFGYATLLSVRIHRLAGATATALGPEGDIRASVPGRKAGDELGALSRSVGDLLRRLRDYTEYLRSLKGKLAHELRTPLAVVSTSLDNIEREQPPAKLVPYLDRIREGTTRLDALITAMSEATAIEQAVTETARQPFDLAGVVASCVSAYGDVHRQRRFRFDSETHSMVVSGSPDLIAQMLDKLVDNAVSFSPPDTDIVIALKRQRHSLILSVSNEGPLLPDQMQAQLFDSLVSVRDEQHRSGRHLGLGLYIAALIARFHHGRLEAANRDDGRGVIVRAVLEWPSVTGQSAGATE